MRVKIALKLIEDVVKEDCDYIGADKGALTLAKLHIPMKLAIGDFDSIEKKDLACIEQYADEIIQLNPIKDNSDSLCALNEAIKRGYDEIDMLGAFGGRMDHSYYNLCLAYQHPNVLTLYDKTNKVYALQKGVYHIKKDGYAFISFFTNTNAKISLEGFEYTITHYEMNQDTIFTLSNSILHDEGILTIEEGCLLVLQTKDA